MKKILITGISGFVGQNLIRCLLGENQYQIVGSVRQNSACQILSPNFQLVNVGDINNQTNWVDVLSGVDVIIHLAARVHCMGQTDKRYLPEFRKVNVAGTRRLIEQALEAGVKRFIFASTIKVCGEKSDHPLTEEEQADPKDAYAISKWEAEQLIQQYYASAKMNFFVFRLPLVYGPGVKGNLDRLVRLVKKGIPLPFGSIDNKRSMIYVKNLADILQKAIEAEEGMNQTYFVADDGALSTPGLIELIAHALGKKARLFTLPK